MQRVRISLSPATLSAEGLSKTRSALSHPNLVVADPFEDAGDFLRGRMGEVY
jgi:hypothetical protein